MKRKIFGEIKKKYDVDEVETSILCLKYDRGFW